MQVAVYFSCYILSVALMSSTFATDTVVRIDTGLLSTNLSFTSRNGRPYLAFLGIPYAAPPVGDLRFEPPQKPRPWTDVRKATEFKSVCVQITYRKKLRATQIKGDEDCLFLNVYTPEIKPEDLMPVLVYFHGGAFIWGSGNKYSAQNLINYPMVVVTCNYRLGVFGFLSSGDDYISGNYGLKDQLALLQWIQRNIEAFGGDAHSVTIMGQSSGANNVHHHMLSQASAGANLFHQAILMSGTALALWSYYPKQNNYASYTFNELLKQTKCNESDRSKNLKCLRSLSSGELKQAEDAVTGNNQSIPFVFRPVVEPDSESAFLVNDPRELKYPNSNISILVGVCSAEGFMNTMIFIRNYQNKTYDHILDEVLPLSIHYQYWARPDDISNITKSLKNFYFKPSTKITRRNILQMINLFGNMLFNSPAVDISNTYPGVRYQYMYDYTNAISPINRPDAKAAHVHGASHGDDSISIFAPSLTGTDFEVSEKMLKYFGNFICFQDPNYETPSDPLWGPVKTKAIEYLFIGNDGFRMKTGMAYNKNYTFYKSLPLGWQPFTATSGMTMNTPIVLLTVFCLGILRILDNQL